MKNNGHLVGFNAAEDFEESPTTAIAAEFENKQEWENVVHNRDYAKIVERENEERKKIASKRRKIVKTRCKTH